MPFSELSPIQFILSTICTMFNKKETSLLEAEKNYISYTKSMDYYILLVSKMKNI